MPVLVWNILKGNSKLPELKHNQITKIAGLGVLPENQDTLTDKVLHQKKTSEKQNEANM